VSSSNGECAAQTRMGQATLHCTEPSGTDADSAGLVRLRMLTLHCSAVPDGDARRCAVLHGNKWAGESEV
jgi:hypothetical protein